MSEPFAPVRSFGDDAAPGTMSAFLPVLILGIAMVVWFGFQAMQLRTERDAMRNVIASQDKQMQDSKKLRDSLDAMARGTAQLADAGNQNAKLIVDELKKRGITITPNQPASGTPAPEPAK